jgi:hypothetical protein
MTKTTHALVHVASRTGALVFVATMLGAACSDPTGPEPCTSRAAVGLGGGSCLVHEDGGALAVHRSSIDSVVARTLGEVRELIPVDGVEIRISAGSEGAIREIGFGGRAQAGEVVYLTFDPSSPHLAPSLTTSLFPLLAHELHHIARQRTVGYGSDLLGAMASEGLADHFSVQVAGGTPPIWATALSTAELDRLLEASRPHWFDGGYDHEAWFFGDGSGIPRWTGYSLGWAIVDRFLEEHPGPDPSDLHDEPTASFAFE